MQHRLPHHGSEGRRQGLNDHVRCPPFGFELGLKAQYSQAMVNNDADGCAFVEAHEDAEVLRLRLGKA